MNGIPNVQIVHLNVKLALQEIYAKLVKKILEIIRLPVNFVKKIFTKISIYNANYVRKIRTLY